MEERGTPNLLSLPGAAQAEVPAPPACLICGEPILRKTRSNYCSTVCTQTARNRISSKAKAEREIFLEREITAWDTEGWGKRIRLIGTERFHEFRRDGFNTRELL